MNVVLPLLKKICNHKDVRYYLSGLDVPLSMGAQDDNDDDIETYNLRDDIDQDRYPLQLLHQESRVMGIKYCNILNRDRALEDDMFFHSAIENECKYIQSGGDEVSSSDREDGHGIDDKNNIIINNNVNMNNNNSNDKELESINQDSRHTLLTIDETNKLPMTASDIGLIQNPTNLDEFLLMGGYERQDIVVYNKKHNKFIKSSYHTHDFNTFGMDDYHQICNVNVVSGVDDDTTIVMSTYSTNYNYCGFYGVFDNILHRWCDLSVNGKDHLYGLFNVYDASTRDNLAKTLKYGRVDKYHFHKTGFCVNRHKKWLVITGGDYPCHNKVSIFKIGDASEHYVPKLVFKFKVKNKMFQYKYHGSVVISKRDHDDDNTIKLLLFGGELQMFDNSFCQITLNFDEINKLQTVIKQTKHGIRSQSQSLGEMKKKAISIDYHPNEYQSINQHSTIYKMGRLFYFSYHWINSQYLIVIGGKTTKSFSVSKRLHTSNKILIYNARMSMWSVYKYDLPHGIFGHKSIITQELNNCRVLHIMGGCKDAYKNDQGSNTYWKIKVSFNIGWKIKRLFWIGYYKNVNNSKCLISNLAKDIVIDILRFVQSHKQTIFDT